ncbi:hypothetical protein [Staphylococcus phage LY01]|nr:hypothetical protein [Staphylococcus phage LY01]
MYISQKVQIRLNEPSKKEFEKNFGYRRWIYNKGLEKWNKRYNYCKMHNYFEKINDDKLDKESKKFIRKLLPDERVVREIVRPYTKTSWRKDRPSMIFETAIADLGKSFDNFRIHKISKFPKFKSKRDPIQSCRYYRKNESAIKLNGRKLKLSKSPEVTLLEDIKFDGVIKEVTISKEIDKWYASFCIDIGKKRPKKVPHKSAEICGVDLGVRTFATIFDSNGECFEVSSQIDKLEKLYNRTKVYNQIMKRKNPNSRNYNDTRIKYQRTWKRIKDIRSNMVHELTTFLVKNYKYITLEDLDVREMIADKNNLTKGIRKSIAESCFYEVKRQLEYKQHIFNSELVQVSRWFPSTQLCSNCGRRNKIGKSKTYKCSCGHKIDRDVNAAINLMNEGKYLLGKVNP